MMIEELSETDLYSLDPLLDELVSANKSLGFRPDYQQQFHKYLKETIPNPEVVVFVAKSDEANVGMIVGLIQDNGPFILPERIGYVRVAVVSSERRREGIGMRLWQEMRCWFSARGIDEVQLCTMIDNEEARSFWESCGFRVTMEHWRNRLEMSSKESEVSEEK